MSKHLGFTKTSSYNKSVIAGLITYLWACSLSIISKSLSRYFASFGSGTLSVFIWWFTTSWCKRLALLSKLESLNAGLRNSWLDKKEILKFCNTNYLRLELMTMKRPNPAPIHSDSYSWLLTYRCDKYGQLIHFIYIEIEIFVIFHFCLLELIFETEKLFELSRESKLLLNVRKLVTPNNYLSGHFSCKHQITSINFTI